MGRFAAAPDPHVRRESIRVVASGRHRSSPFPAVMSINQSLADAGRVALVAYPFTSLRSTAARALRRLAVGLTFGIVTTSSAAAQFVKGGDLVPGPSAQFPLWGTIASPISGVLMVTDLHDYSVSQPSSNFARVWLSVGTQNGGSAAVSPTNMIQYVYIRIDHKGIPEEPTNFNLQLNLGGAPVGRVDHLLTLRPIFSGPNAPSVGRVRIALKRYAVDGSGNYPLMGAFTTSSFSGTDADNGGSTPDGTAIGWEGVATDAFNGFEVRIPAAWFHGDVSKIVEPDGSGASALTTAFFTTGGSFGAVATVRDWLADAAGNNVVVSLSTTSGASLSVTGTQLAYTAQPAAANAYATLSPVSLEVRNSDGTLASGATNAVTLEVATGPVGGTILGTTTVNAVNGTATFSNLSFSVPGSYTLRAKATSLLSVISNSFTISATTPAAPSIASITAATAQLSVAFTAPANDGGATITTYQYSLDGGAWVTRAAGTTASPLVITGLTNGTTYSVRIRAVNAQGGGAASNSMSGTPVAPPAAPANTVVPSISGTTTVGQVLTSSTGTWTGSPAPTFAYQWRRCDAAGSNCADISGAAASTYTLVVADVGSTLRVIVTGTNGSGNASGTSTQTAVIASAPLNTVIPTITGTTTVGQTLTADAGTWTGTPTPTFTYQWRRCDAAGNSCADIVSATTSTYVLAVADIGATLRVAVTGTNSVGNATAVSTQTAIVATAPAAPANTTLPTISGTAQVGQSLTASPGTWTGFPAPTFTYQWRSCDSAGNNCADIAGATASTYTLVSGDATHTIRVVVTGTNGSGNATATASQTAVVAEAPANTLLPTISGTAEAGQLLTANTGTWTGTPAPSFTYQWRRCDTSGASCADIVGATGSTYSLAVADIGATIRVVVTGTNTAGNAAATSTQTTTVAPAPVAPSNTVLPTISGTAVVGQTLTANAGTWSANPAPTLTHQWQRCDAAGSNCADISGATATTYVLASGDAGATIRVTETGTNASGNASVTSLQTGVVATPPVNTVAASISGTAQEGQTLTASPGTWTGVPAPSFTYQWRRCDAAGNNCADIALATASTYTLGALDVSGTARVVVTGTNTAGNSASTSAQTVAIIAAGAAPANSAPPTISGTAQVGQVLTVSVGTWTGIPAPTLTHQWRRCDSAGSNCTDIAGATSATYTIVTGDIGATIRVVETGTNATSNASATSAQTAVVIAAPASPANTTAPTITGSAVVGQTLTAHPGTWTGNPAPTLTYQWRQCDSAGANCVAIVGATGATYLLTQGDLGRTVRVAVTGTNGSGNVTVVSAQTAVVAAAAAPPLSITLPTISGTPEVGQVLTATTGSWSGNPAPTLTYQWQRCDSAGANCVNVAGGTGSNYALTSDDLHGTIKVIVTGVNGSGSVVVSSLVTTPVKPGKVDATHSHAYALQADSSHVGSTPADSVPADGTRYSTIRIELRDAAGDLLGGRAADITIALDGTATASTVRETTTPGIYEVDFRSIHVNTVKITASMDSVTLDERPAVNFVPATAQLDIALSASTETPQIGQTVVFTIEVKDLGPNAATGVEVEHQIADRFRFVSSEATRGQYDASKGIWTLGGLAVGESAVLKVTVVVTK